MADGEGVESVFAQAMRKHVSAHHARTLMGIYDAVPEIHDVSMDVVLDRALEHYAHHLVRLKQAQARGRGEGRA